MAVLDNLTEIQKKYIGYSTQELHAGVDLGTLIQTLIDKCNELEGRIEAVETAE